MNNKNANLSNDFRQQIHPVRLIDKSKGYFELPAFEIPDETNGPDKSRIVLQFNYQASKNFTITHVPATPVVSVGPTYDLYSIVGTPFILCIRYRIGGTVYRYKLWSINYDDNSLKDYVYYPTYNGQIIKKNFCLEIWSYRDEDLPGNILASNLLNPVKFAISIRAKKDKLDDSDDFEEAKNPVVVSKLGLEMPLLNGFFPEGSNGGLTN